MYYFAYGSNMDEKDLKEWCKKKNRTFPDWKELGVACLETYELSFNYCSTGRNGGAANLMNVSGSYVYGLLFEITKEYDIETLRKKEGCPNYYEEIDLTVKWGGKDIKNVKTYKVVKEKEKSDHQKPTKDYMDLILNNALKNKFPSKYIQHLKSIVTQ